MKRKTIKTFLALMLAALLLLSCRLTSPVVDVPTNAPLPTSTPYPADAPESSSNPNGEVLFSDDFSSPDTGWDRNSWEEGSTDYSDGVYSVFINESQYDIWANPGQYFEGDVRIEADAYRFRGEDDNDYGLICRYSGTPETPNFYFGIISSDGYAVIGKTDAESTTYLSSEQMEKVNGINGFFETNHLRFDCVGSELTLYVNGQKIATAGDTSFTGGDVGLIAGTFDIPMAEIHFDNLVVMQP